jgi:hypothetical protein
MGELKKRLIMSLVLVLIIPGAFSQVEEETIDEEETEDRLVIPEDEFVPTEQISEDNAVPFPVDI